MAGNSDMSAHREDIRNYTAKYFEGKLVDGDLTATIRELRIDSLDLVEFLMALEEKFEIEINPDEIDLDMTLEQFCEVVDGYK
jgi:acyl carrier protein